MIDVKTEIKTQLDAFDALDHTASMLRGLGFLCVSLCDSPCVIDEDTFGLIADIAYHCSDIEARASEIIYAEYRKNSREKNAIDQTNLTTEKPEEKNLELAA